MATITELFDLVLQHYQSRNLQQAEALCRQVLQADPSHAAAHHLLGLLAAQAGRPEAAITLIRQAIALNPADADCHFNLGIVLMSQGQAADAITCFRQVLLRNPHHAQAHNNLGNALQDQGQLAEAVACYRQALRSDPHSATAYFNLGKALKDQGELTEAAWCYRQVLAKNPHDADALNGLSGIVDAHIGLGNACKEREQLAEAAACYRQALGINPKHADAHNNLGVALKKQGHVPEAVLCYRQALEINHRHADAHNNLGNALKEQGQLDDARACFQRALDLEPGFAEAYNNLGIVLTEQGEPRAALACYERALECKPDYSQAHSNLIYALHFCPGFDARAIYDENRRWNQRYAEPLAKFIGPHDNERSPDRRLRIGYVSPDFSFHPVGRFMLPLLEAHDHERMAIYCYSSVRVPDSTTERCRAHADAWRNVLGLADEHVALLIRQDQIDILVDLTMHTENNRLLVFARKPAPVQVTYLAYCGTTGLGAIDYRLTDPYLDPPGQEEGFYAEESIRLPQTYWCYQPPPAAPGVNRLPAMGSKHVTFGCLNSFSKVTEPTLSAWRRLLAALPQARLLLHAKAGSHRDRVQGFMAQEGVAPGRITFVDRVPTSEYFRIYEQMDIALDPFPYGGGTTTCDALWMGAPVVSLAGQTAVGRGGLSILSNVGLADFVASNTDEYVQIAVRLAGDLSRLSELRATLRERLQRSPLMDAPRFAQGIEAAFRRMWHRLLSQDGPP